VVRWRCVDLRGEVIERFTVTVHERTIGKWLRKLKFTRMQPRPFYAKKDAEVQRIRHTGGIAEKAHES
jgi:transposase